MTLLGDLGPTVIGVMAVELALALVFVIARVYTRLVLKPLPLGWDDYTIVMSVILLAVYSFLCMAAAVLGMGRHSDTLTIPQISHANKIEIIGQTFCILGIATSKTSVALFLMRIVVHRWQKAILIFLSVSVSIICILCAIIDFAQCTPVEHVWNPTIPGTCWTSITTWSFATGGVSIAMDFILAILPWQILYGLQMPLKDKALIGISLSFGIFAGASGIVRAIALSGLNARSDYTYQTVSLILWSSTELTITIVSASIPTLRPLWHRFTTYSRYRSSDAADEFSDPSRNRIPFLSHHMKNLERRKEQAKDTEDTMDSVLFSTVSTVIDSQKKTILGDEESGTGILANSDEIGQQIHKKSLTSSVLDVGDE